MSVKKERTRASSARGIKILNDEQTNSLSPLPVMTSVPVSPTKQITMTIARTKAVSKTKKQKDMDHYVLHTFKGDTDVEGEIDETIDFILSENNGEEKEFAPSGEITEELQISGDEHDDDDDDDHATSEEVKTEEIIEHVCGKCFKTFRRVSGLKKHLDFCRFDSSYSLRKAEMMKNLEKIEKDAIVMENKDICFCCGENFDTCHLGHISCPDCPKSFKTQSSYERHIFITHSEFNDYPCTVCNAKLRSENLLKLHVEQHKTRGKPYACKICGKDFTRSYHLKRHQKYSSCSADANDAMYCKVCNKVFFRLDNLRAHLKQHLGELTKKKSEYMCTICKSNFYSLSTLNIHTRTHTGERPFDCDLCDKKFPSLVALKKHRRYHTGEKPYTCGVCSQSFAVKEILNRHMKRHTGERPHVCPECKKSFIQGTELKNHLKTHLRPYQCSECDEKFKTEKQLIRHGKVHFTRVPRLKKDFHCKLCDIHFVQQAALTRHLKSKQHMTLENAQKRTDCAICEKNFDTVKNLEFHILKVHEVDPEDFINKLPSITTGMPIPNEVKMEDDAAAENSNRCSEANMEPISVDGKCDIGSTVSRNGINEGVVVQEFIVDELPTTSNAKQTIFLQNEAYTIIPLNSEDLCPTKSADQVSPTLQKPEQEKETRFGLRKSLAESLAAAIADDDDEQEEQKQSIANEEDEKIKENVSKLLDMLVDKATLKKFGWPESSVEEVLCKVIENCGHDLSRDSENYKSCDYTTRMREYVKLLFTVVIQNDSIKELLNNYPIDEVIEYVLGNDEDDENDDNNGDENDVEMSEHVANNEEIEENQS